MKRALLFVLVWVLLAVTLAAANPPSPLLLDGFFDDWSGIPLVRDPGGAGADGINLDSVAVLAADSVIAVHFTDRAETILQGNNSIRLLADLDNNPATGMPVDGAGVDLVWSFGKRSGVLYSANGEERVIGTEDINLVTMPSMSSSEFEIGFRRNFVPGSTLRLRLESTAKNGDSLPDRGFVDVPIVESEPLPPLSLEKQDPNHLRLMLWNVWDDHYRHQPESFTRIIRAANPDVMILVDASAGAGEIKEKVEEWLPNSPTGFWNVRHQGEDVAVASPWPILNGWDIPGMPRAGLFLVQFPEPFTGRILIAAIHPICCSNDSIRQQQVDALLAFIRDAYTSGGELSVDPSIPLLIIGDTNLVGWRSQYFGYTLGRIHDEKTFGSSFNTNGPFPLTDIRSRHPEAPYAYSWRDDSTAFGPARIDLLFLPTKRLGIGTNYFLDTRTLSAATRERYGLKWEDNLNASDHIPHIVDIYPVK